MQNPDGIRGGMDAGLDSDMGHAGPRPAYLAWFRDQFWMDRAGDFELVISEKFTIRSQL